MIDDFVWSKLRKKIGDLGFFFFACYGLLVVVVVLVVVVGVGVVVGVADGRGGYRWCCGYFLGSGIYYFIVVVILLWCLYYFIMLKAKIDLLLQHVYW